MTTATTWRGTGSLRYRAAANNAATPAEKSALPSSRGRALGYFFAGSSSSEAGKVAKLLYLADASMPGCISCAVSSSA